jgi:ATP-binding cassette, subfamily B, bacterial
MREQDSDDLSYDEWINGRIFQNKPFRTLLKIFRGNIGKLLISYLFFAMKHSATWVMPIIIANVVDLATSPAKHSLNELWINLAAGFFVVIQNIPTSVLYNKFLSTALRNVEAELRSNMVRKLQMLSISFYRRFESGKIQSKMIRDVESIIMLARQISNGIVPIIMNLTVVLVITFCKNRMVTGFFLVSIPLSLVVIRAFRKNIRSTNSSFRHEIEDMSSEVTEMIEMVPVTRAQALEHVEISRIDSRLKKIKTVGHHLDLVTAFFGASAWLSMQVMQLVCLGFSGYLSYTGRITVGEIVLYQTYFTQILNQVNSLVNVYPEIMKGFESIRSIGEIFLADDVEDYSGGEKLSEIKGDFDFEHVCVRYSPTAEPSLYDFSLHVRAGEKIAIVGESGAGKTTLLNLIIGFVKPVSGMIRLDGRNMAAVDLKSIRSHIAFVPQNVVLFPGTIRENITYGMNHVSDERLRQIVDSACLAEVFDSLPDGIDTRIGEHGDTLSGGQKQRITIARALIRDPEIIILDEATSALDSASERHVQRALDTLTKGHTTFIVAHRLSTVRSADRIVVLSKGECVETGNYEQLMERKGAFYKMNEIQRA